MYFFSNYQKFGETDEFSATAYLRVFGNELRYWDTTDFRAFDYFSYYIRRKGSIEIQKTMGLLDSGLVIPTCIGLPLNLSITATGSVHINRTKEDRSKKFELKFAPR